MLSDVTTTSPVLQSVHRYAIVAGLVFLGLIAPLQPRLIPLPFFLACVAGGKLNCGSGILLAVVWSLWLCLCAAPLLLYSRSAACLLVLYAPALVLVKRPSAPASGLFIVFLNVVWDIPQLIWIKSAHLLSIRAIEVFTLGVAFVFCKI
jgi:hypothetical protein